MGNCCSGICITPIYKFERERWGDQVIRHYKFMNDKESKLGTEPLPDGGVMVTRRVTDDNLLAFVGRTNVKYMPINEEVEMETGQRPRGDGQTEVDELGEGRSAD